MKKILLAAFCATLFIGTATTTKAQNLKQSGGEKNLQVLFAPLGGSPISINGITFRKFNATGSGAWRVNLFVGMNSETETISQPIDTGTAATGGAKPEGEKTTSGFNFSIKPGYEWHMAGTERLSPYWGVELLFAMATSKTETDTVARNAANNNWVVLTRESEGDDALTTFGINLVAGVDYYFTKNLHLGAELGFGWSMTAEADIDATAFQTDQTTGEWEVVDVNTQIQDKSMQLGPNVVGQFKLGWLF